MRSKKRLILIIFFLLVFVSASLGYLSFRLIQHDDPDYMVAAQKISKSFIMKALDSVQMAISGSSYTPTPFDSGKFRYANLAHPYFEKVRSDHRLAKFYSNNSRADLKEVLLLKDYLRDLFPHGEASRDYIHSNVIEMIDAAEDGEKFLCGDIAKMLAQLIMAGGTQARTVILESEESGHVVVEFWSDKYDKWILVDPDYNVFYTGRNNVPLSAYELYLIANDDKKGGVKRHLGKSKNNILDERQSLIEEFYRNGIAINYYNKWLGENLPRIHPGRSPAITSFYVGNSPLEQYYYKHDAARPGPGITEKLYLNPANYQPAFQ